MHPRVCSDQTYYVEGMHKRRFNDYAFMYTLLWQSGLYLCNISPVPFIHLVMQKEAVLGVALVVCTTPLPTCQGFSVVPGNGGSSAW